MPKPPHRQLFIEFSEGSPTGVAVQVSGVGDDGRATGWVNVDQLDGNDPLRRSVKLALMQALGNTHGFVPGSTALVALIDRAGNYDSLFGMALSRAEQVGLSSLMGEACDELQTFLHAQRNEGARA